MQRLIVLSFLLAPTAARAQAARDTVTPVNTYFAFQVDRPATWIPDTTLAMRPTRTTRNAMVRVAFVVDTTGRPLLPTLRVIHNGDSSLAERANAAIAHWKFFPALRDGRRVSQLVVMGIEARPRH